MVQPTGDLHCSQFHIGLPLYAEHTVMHNNLSPNSKANLDIPRYDSKIGRDVNNACVMYELCVSWIDSIHSV